MRPHLRLCPCLAAGHPAAPVRPPGPPAVQGHSQDRARGEPADPARLGAPESRHQQAPQEARPRHTGSESCARVPSGGPAVLICMNVNKRWRPAGGHRLGWHPLGGGRGGPKGTGAPVPSPLTRAVPTGLCKATWCPVHARPCPHPSICVWASAPLPSLSLQNGRPKPSRGTEGARGARARARGWNLPFAGAGNRGSGRWLPGVRKVRCAPASPRSPRLRHTEPVPPQTSGPIAETSTGAPEGPPDHQQRSIWTREGPTGSCAHPTPSPRGQQAPRAQGGGTISSVKSGLAPSPGAQALGGSRSCPGLQVVLREPLLHTLSPQLPGGSLKPGGRGCRRRAGQDRLGEPSTPHHILHDPSCEA